MLYTLKIMVYWSNRMNKILHISADFPDQLNSNSTNAVKNLIDGTKDWDHIIFSLNRVFHKKK